MTPLNYYGFVIDTDQYAGNFEREMCAYLTGIADEYGRGAELVEDLSVYFENVKFVYTEYGSRPCEIYKNNQGFYNSVIIYFEDRPRDEQIAFMKERIKIFEWSDLKIYGFRLIQFKTEVIEEQV